MLGLRNLTHFTPEAGGAVRTWESGRYNDRDGQVWRELNMNELVFNEEFLQAGL
jgi:hypothetical protein